MLQFPAQYVVYGYLYIGIGMLIFNLCYMNSRPGRARLQKRRTKQWADSVLSALCGDGEAIRPQKLQRKLCQISQMQAFSDALEQLEGEYPGQLRQWLEDNAQVFRNVAMAFRRRGSMERAYCAWFLARFSLIGPEDRVLLDTVVSYLENSTIYCRENVLKAIYHSGSVSAVVDALQHFNDRSYYHNRKLLSDGLATFSGDQAALAQALWAHWQDWNDELMASVVQFITRMGPGGAAFAETFLQTLNAQALHPELAVSLIRYFARFPYEPAREILLRLAGEEQTLYAIVAVTALASYPGMDSIGALRQAVCSRNWYVRTNAAASLIALTREHPDREALLQCPDAYGAQSIAYCLSTERSAQSAPQ